MRRVPVLLLMFAFGAWAAPGFARAQDAGGPRYLDSDPQPGDFLHKAPGSVSITFSEPLGSGSQMSVSDECGRRLDDGNVLLEENEMRVDLAVTPSGSYTVTYVAQGAEDGSGAVPGSFGFRVHLGPDCRGGTQDGGQVHDHHGGGGGTNDTQHGSDHDTDAAAPHGEHSGSTVHLAGAHSAHEDTSHSPGHTKPRHKSKHHHRHGSGRQGSDNPREGNDGDDLSAHPSAAAREGDAEATRTDVLLALGLAALLGAVGGLILRASPER